MGSLPIWVDEDAWLRAGRGESRQPRGPAPLGRAWGRSAQLHGGPVNQDLGSLDINHITEGPSRWRIGAHSGGSCGIDFDYITKVDINHVIYTYNTAPATLDIGGIHLAQSATGAPNNPGAWAFSGSFGIGDLGASTPTPATIDVGTDASGNPSMQMNLPMTGTIRVEDVTFGGTDFGPSAIDGITVHHLNVQMVP